MRLHLTNRIKVAVVAAGLASGLALLSVGQAGAATVQAGSSVANRDVNWNGGHGRGNDGGWNNGNDGEWNNGGWNNGGWNNGGWNNGEWNNGWNNGGWNNSGWNYHHNSGGWNHQHGHNQA